jgi:hypothetical protein
VADCCEHGNESSAPIKGGELCDELSYYQFLQKVCFIEMDDFDGSFDYVTTLSQLLGCCSLKWSKMILTEVSARIWEQMVMAYLRKYLGICLTGQRTSVKISK